MNRRLPIVAVTAGLLAIVPTAAWADQKPASSVVSNQKFELASYFNKGGYGSGHGWGRGWGWGKPHDNRPGHGNHGHHYGHGGGKSHGC